ncbi:MAG: D-glycero-beta-D-manno-heptose 1-phosphate adenylyltransferase [Candidatus Cloacimonadaceae bacterium]
MSINKIIDWQEIPVIKATGQTVVFTNGCFDIIHAGHVQYLQQAKDLGDILVVGLNSDASVRRLKGSSRPINSEENRALILAALQSVNYVIIFDEDTPYELIEAVQPDVLVKGGDWKEDDIVGSDIVKNKGGRVISLPFWEGLSTTNIIKKMR